MRTNLYLKLRMALYISYRLFDFTITTWMTVVILELNMRKVFIIVDLKPTRVLPDALVVHRGSHYLPNHVE